MANKKRESWAFFLCAMNNDRRGCEASVNGSVSDPENKSWRRRKEKNLFDTRGHRGEEAMAKDTSPFVMKELHDARDTLAGGHRVHPTGASARPSGLTDRASSTGDRSPATVHLAY